MLDLFVLKYLLALLDHSFPHPHYLLHVLVLEVNDLLEGVLVCGDHLLVFVIHSWRVVCAETRGGEGRLILVV